MPNFMSTVQVLESWCNKRVVDPRKLDDVLTTLNSRRASAMLPTTEPPSPTSSSAAAPAPASGPTASAGASAPSSLTLDPFGYTGR